jgi:Zn-dependent protease
MLAQINIGLAIFNLIPVPPLDGYRILNQFAFGGKLDQSLTPQAMMIIRYAFLILCITGILSPALSKVIGSVFTFFLNRFWKIL